MPYCFRILEEEHFCCQGLRFISLKHLPNLYAVKLLCTCRALIIKFLEFMYNAIVIALLFDISTSRKAILKLSLLLRKLQF